MSNTGTDARNREEQQPDQPDEDHDTPMTDDTLDEFVTEAINENTDAVNDYHKGEEGAVNFLVGQVMQKSKGLANPSNVYQLVRTELNLQQDHAE